MKPKLTVIINNRPITSSTPARQIIEICRRSNIRLVANQKAGFKLTNTPLDAA